jgi:DNA-binding GntR family transcriptional regulator
MTFDPAFSPAASGSPNAVVVAALEEDIVFGRLHPRERLIEDDLMQRFAVKRHVVREVLATLDRMGLIERRRNVGALVRSFAPKEVTELYAVRGLLETEAARLIPLPVPEPALGKLVGIQQQHDEAVDANDPRRVFRANLGFHEALFELTGNETLQRAIAEYARQTHPIRFSSLVTAGYRERARHEHWRIIEALRAGDRSTLVALCGEHLLPSRDAYLAAHGHQDEAA